MSIAGSENQANMIVPTRRIRSVAGAAILLLLILVGAETTVRIEDRIRWGMPLLASDTSTADLMVSDRTGRHPAPGKRFRKWQINSVGTRGPEPDPSHAARRVLVLGASETFGLYESPGQEYVRQLADTLAAGDCAADALNAGFVGMSLPTVEQDFRLRLASLQPKVVVYYPTPPQYLDDALPRAVVIDSNATAPPTSGWHSRFKLRARDAFKAMLPRAVLDLMRQRQTSQKRLGVSADSMFATIPAARLAAFESDLRRLVGTLRAHDAVPVLVTHGNAFIGTPKAGDDRLRAWEKFYPRATGATLVAFDSAAAESVRRIAADSSVALVDAWREFHGVPAEEMFADFSHFTDAGSARMASLLRPAIAQALGCGHR